MPGNVFRSMDQKIKLLDSPTFVSETSNFLSGRSDGKQELTSLPLSVRLAAVSDGILS